MISLRDVLDGTAGMLRGSAAPDLLFRRVWHDSRTVEPGDLFVAVRGERHDGHDFVADAVRRGAAGALVEARRAEELADLGIPLIVVDDTLAALLRLASYWRRLFAVPVAAVTGSVGKTSTKEAIASVLAQRFQVVRSRASFNTDVGIALDLLTIDPNTDVVVLEFGEAYRLGEVRELCALAEPRIGVVTNVSYAHLARMGTIERIAQSIAELPESLPADGVAVLNGDDFRVRLMAERTPARVLLYGLSPDCHVRAEEIESRGLDGISFDLVAFGERNRVRLPLLGQHSVHHALAAIAVGYELGLTLEEMLPGFHDPRVQVRLLTVPGINGATLLDDTYNASPASCMAALSLLAEIPAQRRIAVFGDMYELGWYEEEGHRMVGRRAAAVVDRLFTLGPRARWIAEAAIEAGLAPERVWASDDRRELVAVLRETLRPGDFVLIKGARGMRMEEIVEALRAAQETEQGR
ncbi:MAG: UDP-N-acetylmuramoyl-tripeptide--D-alanyl-D-alanine ligase [Thermomicrobium sp.]|nr:UDP-N-acetylmuramoyl-tripeptide--D-alanyl-D-alanine ligase [Thermomicrobium sp.]